MPATVTHEGAAYGGVVLRFQSAIPITRALFHRLSSLVYSVLVTGMVSKY